MLEDLEDAELRARGENAEPRGSLKVAAPILFGRIHVLPIISQVLTKHPGLKIHLTLSDRNVHLSDEFVDVAVRIGGLADSSMMAIRLGFVSRILVASPGYLRLRGTPKAPVIYPPMASSHSRVSTRPMNGASARRKSSFASNPD